MNEDQKRLSELTGELNQVMGTMEKLRAEQKRILAELDYYEKIVQGENRAKLDRICLTPAQLAVLDRVCEGCEE
jgi:hypothetical protein